MSISESGEAVGPLTLADRLDELMLRLDLWRPKARTVVLLSCALATLTIAGWLLLRPTPNPSIEDSIPMVGAESGVGVVGADGGATEPADTSQGEQGGAALSGGNSTGQTGEGPAADGSSPTDQAEADGIELVVHVAGAVRRPGLVRLDSGSRISDAVQAAGGPTAAADVHRLNLAAPVLDGMQVRVPTVDEEPTTGSLLSYPAETGDGSGENQVVNINTAASERLQTLPGVGPAIAAAIIAWREDQGPFQSVDELEAVPGIGPAKLAGLRDHATI